jgi:hypothetical protein
MTWHNETGDNLSPNVGRESPRSVCSSPSDAVEKQIQDGSDGYAKPQREGEHDRGKTGQQQWSKFDPPEPTLPNADCVDTHSGTIIAPEEAIGTDAPQQGKTSPTCSKSFSLVRVLRRWRWCSRLRILWPELCNLTHRIRWARGIQLWELRGFQGQHPLELKATPNSQCRICRPVYILYMQQLLNLRPSLTVVDSCLVSQAWWAGWRSAHHMGRLQNPQNKCSSCSPMDSDSMPPQAIQQSTKHDPQSPLPSRG